MINMNHTDQANRVSRDTGWNLDEYATERDWTGVAIGPVGQHRDSLTLDRSNFDAVYGDLRGRFGEAVDVVSFGHWGVGWIEEVASDAGRVDVQAAIEAWRDALADYPVADEETFCALEYAEALETIEACRSSSLTRDGIEYELSDLLPDDWTSQVFSDMFDAGADTSPDGMRGDSIDGSVFDCGFYVPAYPLVALDSFDMDDAPMSCEANYNR